MPPVELAVIAEVDLDTGEHRSLIAVAPTRLRQSRAYPTGRDLEWPEWI
jgi:hypothetical protein